MRATYVFAIAATLACAGGCGAESGEVESFGAPSTSAFDARNGSVVLEGCQLDTWQTSQLVSDPAHRAIKTVILLCPTMHPNGSVVPTDPDARARLAQTIANLRTMGYAVHLAVGIADDTDALLSADRVAQLFADANWRAAVFPAITELAQMSDGIEIDLQSGSAAMRDNLTTFVQALGTAIRPARFLGIFVPPSTMTPSDTPTGDAYDLGAIVSYVDRIRVMTLDYSCCNGQAGPTIESGWAVDAARFAMKSALGTPIDIAMPLYGVDFSAGGRRPVTWLEAAAVAQATHASIDRVTAGAQHYTWRDEAGLHHETWFDDSVSTTRVLAAWSNGTLPSDVGVVFYGLGAEDPTLWDAIARGMR
jgi:spore germination protein YaaH